MNRTLIAPQGWISPINRLFKRVLFVALIDSTNGVLSQIATRVLRLNFEQIPMRYRLPAFGVALGGTALFWTWLFTIFGATSIADAELSFIGMLVAYIVATLILLLVRVNFTAVFTALVIYPITMVARFLGALLRRWD